MPLFRRPEPDEHVDSFDGAVIRLEHEDGKTAGHLVCHVVRNWVPLRRWQWMVSVEVHWVDGTIDHDEDVPPWAYLLPMKSGSYTWVGEGDPHEGEYRAMWLSPEDADRWIHEKGIDIESV